MINNSLADFKRDILPHEYVEVSHKRMIIFSYLCYITFRKYYIIHTLKNASRQIRKDYSIVNFSEILL